MTRRISTSMTLALSMSLAGCNGTAVVGDRSPHGGPAGGGDAGGSGVVEGQHDGTVTWNPADSAGGIVLSADLLTATGPAESMAATRATKGKRSGRWYWEVTVFSEGVSGSSVGVATAQFPPHAAPGWVGYGCGWSSDATVTCNEEVSPEQVGHAPYVAGDVLGIAVDIDAHRVYWSRNGEWEAGSDPALGIGGSDLGWDPAKPAYVPMITPGDGGSMRANFGGTPFAHAIPGGFSALAGPNEPHVYTPSQDIECGDGGYFSTAWRAADPPAGTGVRVLSVYTASTGSLSGYGSATVDIGDVDPAVLVLEAYDPVTWNLSIPSGAQIEKVVAIGYHVPVVHGAGSVPVEILSCELSHDCIGGGSLVPGGSGGDPGRFMRELEARFGRPVVSFDYCYVSTRLSLSPL